MPKKKNWIMRMINLFQDLELGVIYNKTNIRNHLKINYNDAISLPTTSELLDAIIEAQEKGLYFRFNDKTRRIVKKKSATKDFLFELIEED